MKKLFHSARGGFTVVEMVIVVGIVALLSTTVVVQFQHSRNASRVDEAVEILTADIRQVMNWAQTGQSVTIAGVSTLPPGYGILLFQSSSEVLYNIYADIDGNHQYTNSADDYIVDVTRLEIDEFIDGVAVSQCTPLRTPQGFCDFLITGPEGVMYTNGAQQEPFSFVLENVETGEARTVTVDIFSGQIRS